MQKKWWSIFLLPEQRNECYVSRLRDSLDKLGPSVSLDWVSHQLRTNAAPALGTVGPGQGGHGCHQQGVTWGQGEGIVGHWYSPFLHNLSMNRLMFVNVCNVLNLHVISNNNVSVMSEVIEDNVVQVQVKASIFVDDKKPQGISFMDCFEWTWLELCRCKEFFWNVTLYCS